MISENQIRELLAPFGLPLTSEHVKRLQVYLELLLRWNAKINLTAIRSAEECVTRHFGESLYLVRFAELEGRLLDIGSGAGFPGLALKITSPSLQVTLLEPVGKKRAFLKEVARACEMDLVEVRSERLSEFVKQQIQNEQHQRFDAATSRAVGRLAGLIPEAAKCLKEAAGLYLWLSHDQHEEVRRSSKGWIAWTTPIALPLAKNREIWCGRIQKRNELRHLGPLG
jgi:16S rRNA (guanine527-N7)-methyltransferase